MTPAPRRGESLPDEHFKAVLVSASLDHEGSGCACTLAIIKIKKESPRGHKRIEEWSVNTLGERWECADDQRRFFAPRGPLSPTMSTEYKWEALTTKPEPK